jgi:hypothetical protein
MIAGVVLTLPAAAWMLIESAKAFANGQAEQ